MTTELTLAQASALATKDVEQLIGQMLELEQSDCPVLHHFAPGLYIREIRFPAGVFAVGHIQRYEQMNVFIQGRVLMVKPNGEEQEICAPMTFMAPAGRKAGFILDDVIWQNIYPNPDNETDIEKLEAKWLVETPCFEAFKVKKLLTTPDGDYEKMLTDLGVTEEQVNAESGIETDRIAFPPSWAASVAVRKSNVHGRGLFAEANVFAGQLVCPARIDGKRTPAGVFANHSGNPNAKPVLFNDTDIGFVALKDIHGRRGGMNGEEITVDYRQVYAIARGTK